MKLFRGDLLDYILPTVPTLPHWGREFMESSVSVFAQERAFRLMKADAKYYGNTL
jgi:hypothetical protein